MKKKILILVITIILIIVAIVVGILKNKKTEDNYSELGFIDNQNKYIITTDIKWISMQNDGGSHTNVYYQIDFNKSTVQKCEDKYVGFDGYEYKEKIIFSKKLSETEKSQLKSILDNAIKNGTEKTDAINFNFYLISSFDSEDVKIYNNEIINIIKNILDK